MITFILIVCFFLGISYLIFKQKAFGSKRITSLTIIILGTLILYTVASGLIAKRYPLKRVIYDTEVLNGLTSLINDTIFIKASIGYDFDKQKVYIENDESYNIDLINVKFLSKHDTIPKFIITQEERQIDSYLWVASWGIPYQNREYSVYVPNNKENIKMISLIFDNINKTKDEEAI